MSTVIGLSPYQQDIVRQLHVLEEAGYSKDRVRVISKEGSIYQILGCSPGCIVTNYTGWGAFFGILIYGIFALVASWCECNIFLFSHEVGFGIILVGILFGAFAGGFIGFITGLAEYEKDTHLYTQGIHVGSKVLVLDVNVEESERAKTALHNLGCTGIRVIEEPIKD
jgi:hypothetical protein